MRMLRILIAVCALAPAASAEEAHFAEESCSIPWVAEQNSHTVAFEMACQGRSTIFQVTEQDEGWGQILPRTIWGFVKKGDRARCPATIMEVRESDRLTERELTERYMQCAPEPQIAGNAPEK